MGLIWLHYIMLWQTEPYTMQPIVQHLWQSSELEQPERIEHNADRCIVYTIIFSYSNNRAISAIEGSFSQAAIYLIPISFMKPQNLLSKFLPIDHLTNQPINWQKDQISDQPTDWLTDTFSQSLYRQI